MYCNKCGKELPPNTRYCPSCGFIVQTITLPAKKRSRKKLIVIPIIIIAFLIVMGIALSPYQVPTPAPALTTEEIKDLAINSLPYGDLMRNIDDYKGKIVYYRGEVVQVEETSKDNYIMRIYVTKNFFWKDAIWANYHGERILEGDIIDVWGEVKGLRKYYAVLGQVITIPEIDVLHLEIVVKYGEKS